MSFSRRDFLVRSAFLALGGPAFLAACSSDKISDATAGASPDATGATSTGDTTAAARGTGSGKVRIASWPLYIEDDQNPNKAPTIANFTKKTGIAVDYSTAVDSNDGFTTKYEGDLKNGKGIGFDVVVLTSWMASRWIQNGWAQEIPADKVPNRTNLLDRMADPAWDPGRKYSLPYAIGQVGLAYYPDKVGGEITGIKDLLDPKLKGKVTILSEMRDAVGLFLLADGVKPEDTTVDQALTAIGEIKKARDDGQFRKITGNSYIEDLGLKEISAAMAWSGDVASLQKDQPDLKWVLPKAGAESFVDTMLIPIGGDVDAAAAWMNWLYDPTVSGPLFEAISYTSPVKGASESMTAEGKANPLINPPESADIHEFRDLSEADAATLETAFAEATQQ